MSTSSNDTIFALGTTAITIAPGATLAYYLFEQAYQNSTFLKYGSGGTLYMIGVTHGTTLSAAQLVTNATGHYLFGSTESLSIDGPISCYLLALSATTIVYPIKGLSQ